MIPSVYEYIQTQPMWQRILTAVFYPILNLMAAYFAVMFFALVLDEIDFHD